VGAVRAATGVGPVRAATGVGAVRAAAGMEAVNLDLFLTCTLELDLEQTIYTPPTTPNKWLISVKVGIQRL
jgi:hypothetical protein